MTYTGLAGLCAPRFDARYLLTWELNPAYNG